MRNSQPVNPASKWYLRIDQAHDRNDAFHKLTQLTSNFHGNVPVVIYESETKRTWRLDTQFNLQSGTLISEKLMAIFGTKNVVYK
nr:hypothetical protein [Lentilactobacillus kisonensis]